MFYWLKSLLSSIDKATQPEDSHGQPLLVVASPTTTSPASPVIVSDEEEQPDLVFLYRLSKAAVAMREHLAQSPMQCLDTLQCREDGLCFVSHAKYRNTPALIELLKTRKDVYSKLNDGQMLNDDIIHDFCKKLVKHNPDVNLMNSQLMGMEIKDIEAKLTRKQQGKNKFDTSCHFWGFPGFQKIGEESGHWYAVMMDVTDKYNPKIYCCDSLGWTGQHHVYFEKAQAVLNILYPDSKKAERISFAIPNQGNAVDCGVSACMMIEKFAKGELDNEMIQGLSRQKHFDYGPYRHDIAALIAMDDNALSQFKQR